MDCHLTPLQSQLMGGPSWKNGALRVQGLEGPISCYRPPILSILVALELSCDVLDHQGHGRHLAHLQCGVEGLCMSKIMQFWPEMTRVSPVCAVTVTVIDDRHSYDRGIKPYRIHMLFVP